MDEIIENADRIKRIQLAGGESYMPSVKHLLEQLKSMSPILNYI